MVDEMMILMRDRKLFFKLHTTRGRMLFEDLGSCDTDWRTTIEQFRLITIAGALPLTYPTVRSTEPANAPKLLGVLGPGAYFY